MENTFSTDMTTVFGEVIPTTIFEAAEKIISSAVDISSETDRVVSMTPKDGYQKKIELISEANDLSTKEKIKAIDDAETKYARDLAANAKVCKGMMWTKVGLILTGFAGVVLMVATPEGRKIAKAIIKLAA
ncbi:MAG: hypothetical protein IKN92_05055 [Clostridia bacterium]|nr:hypothetical protein [Clostridia bacterium]